MDKAELEARVEKVIQDAAKEASRLQSSGLHAVMNLTESLWPDQIPDNPAVKMLAEAIFFYGVGSYLATQAIGLSEEQQLRMVERIWGSVQQALQAKLSE